jgi:3-oxoadipate enol-lactonase/4-carboxymuconolactone decarboxylase
VLPRHTFDGPEGAPVLLMSNSLGTTVDMWQAQVPLLSQYFRVLRYEHRGHGGTASLPGPYTIDGLGNDVLELLDLLGIARVAMCGLSLGGMVAMWMAAHHPDRIDSVVLASTVPYLPPPESWSERAASVRASGTSALLETLLGRWFTPGFVDRHPEAVASVSAMLASAESEGYAGCCEAIGSMDLRPVLGRITAPTLVIVGAADPVTPPTAALELHDAIAGSALVVLPAAAHLANVEQPDRFTKLLVEHAAGTPAERGGRVRREVLGADHVGRSAAGATAIDAPFIDLITRYAWGEIWTRPGLDRPTRSCLTIAMLVALGRFDELELHLAAARRNGVTLAQITEVLLQAAVYCGVPAANSAFAVARRVLGPELTAEPTA